ncbi:MAG: alpha/beta hydrolase [Chloroflexi bacterium]|nr:alpha/beta hydrolase [Chloroflexota bacterium]
MIEFTPPFDAPSRYLYLPDVRIHYRAIGEGAPLILLHGLGSSGADWYPLVRGLAEYFRLVLVDLRGFGSSSLARSKDYSVASMATDVRQLMKALDMSSAHVVGLSLGGCVALQLAATTPNQVDHLVLVNTFAKLRWGKDASLSRKIKRLWAARNIDTLASFVANEHFKDPQLRALAKERLRHNDLGVLHRTMWAITRFNLLPQLPAITSPTLILIGDRDRTVPRQCAEELLQAIPHAQLQVIPDAGHALPYDQPQAFLEALLTFLPLPKSVPSPPHLNPG